MCRPLVSPIVPISVAESEATARPSIATFQTLSAGKTVQAGAPGRVGCAADSAAAAGAAVAAGAAAAGSGRRDGSPRCAGRSRRRTRRRRSSRRRRCRRPAGSSRGAARSVFESPSLSGFSRSSRMPSRSVSARSGCVPAFELEAVPQPVVVGVLAVVADAVAVRVGLARVRPERPTPAGSSACRDRGPPAVGEAVAVGVRRRRARQRLRRLVGDGRPSPSGSVARPRRAPAGRPARRRPGARRGRTGASGSWVDGAARPAGTRPTNWSRTCGPGPVRVHRRQCLGRFRRRPAVSWSGSRVNLRRVRPSVLVTRPTGAAGRDRPCGRGWSSGRGTGDDVAFADLATWTLTAATPSPIASSATRSGPRTPSNRHSSSPGATSRGSATERFDAWLYRLLVHACYEELRRHRRWTTRIRSSRSSDRADPTLPSRSTTATRSSAPSAADAGAARGLRPAPPRGLSPHRDRRPSASPTGPCGPASTTRSVSCGPRSSRTSWSNPGGATGMNDRTARSRRDPRRVADEGPTRLPDPTRRAIAVAIPSIRRRRAMRVPWRFPTMTHHAQARPRGVAVVAVVLGGRSVLRPAQSDARSSASPAPTAVADRHADPIGLAEHRQPRRRSRSPRRRTASRRRPTSYSVDPAVQLSGSSPTAAGHVAGPNATVPTTRTGATDFDGRPCVRPVPQRRGVRVAAISRVAVDDPCGAAGRSLRRSDQQPIRHIDGSGMQPTLTASLTASAARRCAGPWLERRRRASLIDGDGRVEHLVDASWLRSTRRRIDALGASWRSSRRSRSSPESVLDPPSASGGSRRADQPPRQSGNASGPRSASSRASPGASSAGSHEYG